jgi:hypothetical protein
VNRCRAEHKERCQNGPGPRRDTAARDLAVTFGADDTTTIPSAQLGHHVVTVWEE